MKKSILVLVALGLITLNVEAQKKAPKADKGNLILELKQELIKKYKYENINIYILSIKLNIDIVDVHAKSLPKGIRADRSKEIADFSKNFLDATPEGKQLLTKISIFGINYLKKVASGLYQPADNIYDKYSFDR